MGVSSGIRIASPSLDLEWCGSPTRTKQGLMMLALPSLPQVVTQTSKPHYIEQLQHAMQEGLPLLLENLGEVIDSMLEPVILRAVRSRNERCGPMSQLSQISSESPPDLRQISARSPPDLDLISARSKPDPYQIRSPPDVRQLSK